MKKKSSHFYKQVCILFFLFLFSYSAQSQNETSNYFTNRFQEYYLNHFQEKIFVHTDKSLYLAGEKIWFKIYLVDGFFHQPSNLSKVVYVEILDKNNNPVLQAKAPLINSTGNAAIKIPNSLLTGSYIFRAYTNWMKNFNAEFYYEQPINIINALSESNRNTPPQKPPSLDVQFFPEGGILVNGINSKIGFKAINQNEEGINFTGIIINQRKDTVARFAPLKFGMGNFMLTPIKGDHYTAVIRASDTLITKDLPLASNQGYTMSVKEKERDKLEVIVHTANVAQNEDLYLLAHSGNLFKWVQSQRAGSDSVIFPTDKASLNEGITHFTVFNSQRKPVCERLFFKFPQKKMNISMELSSPTFNSRDSVAVLLNTMNENGQGVDADLSMSVFLIDSLQPTNIQNNILSYLLLTSDLKGYIQSPNYYFEENTNTSDERIQAIDNLMLTQGWSRFTWEEVLQAKQISPEFLPETEGPLIKGMVVEKRSGQPAADIMAYLSAPGIYSKFSTSASNKNGEILFNPGNFYGSNEIIVQTNNKVDSVYRITISSPFSDHFSSRKTLTFSLSKNAKELLLNRSIASQSENMFHNTDRYYGIQTLDTLPFFGKPDHTYYLDEYTRFTSMEEVMKEYVTETKLKKVDSNYSFVVWNYKYKSFYNDDPLVLIDGVPIFNTNKIISFDPLKIKKMDLLSQTNFTGSLMSHGIISYSTYNGDLAGFPLDENALVVDYAGLVPPQEFYVPKYQNKEQKESRVPDLRNVLFWSPNITTNHIGKTMVSFYTSDFKGKFAIVVQGISKEGVPAYSISSFETK